MDYKIVHVDGLFCLCDGEVDRSDVDWMGLVVKYECVVSEEGYC